WALFYFVGRRVMQWRIGFTGSTPLELWPDVCRLSAFVIAHSPSFDRCGHSLGAAFTRSPLGRFHHGRPVPGPGAGAGLLQSQGSMLRIGKSILWIMRGHSARFLCRNGLEHRHPRIQSSSIIDWSSIGSLGDEQLRLVLDLQSGSPTFLRRHAPFEPWET